MASVKVAVRVRPFNQREIDLGAKLIIQMDGKKTRILNNKFQTPENFKDFTFDHSYWSFNPTDHHFTSQEQVFGELGKDVVDAAFEGYNACVFAYGQTGSGKTFTMTGSPDNQGLIPRICESLFGQMASGASYRTEVSYLEIYNERVKDLLHRDDNNSGHNLRVREHPQHGPYVSDLSRHLVSEYSHIKELMSRGNHYRTTASTNMNDTSSRSHAIFTLMFVQAGFSNDMPSETVSKIHLVDLAGSERADATGATGQRLKEGAHINKSLVTLGSVISALAEISCNNTPVRKSTFIPYRDSVLTWLLKDSLGGNSKTIMIAAVSPADCNYSETLSTLRYANRAKNIINKPTINEDPNVKLIKELRDEITKLKSMFCNDYTVESQPQMLAALLKKEAQEKVLTEKWTEKWRETQKILQEQKALGLRKAGTGVVLDSDMPHLIGIDDDLLSTGVTLYHLKDGETTIGTEEAITKPDILLNGQDIEADHCSIVLRSGVATLIPHQLAQCWVNGALIDKPTRLSQGCNILLGRTNMFRYNDPVEAEKLRKEGSRSLLNLSRLSLLSWSTPDLVVSNENLHVHGDDTEKLDNLEQRRTELMREKEAFKIEQAEKEQGWEREQRQKREALETAQKQLELERQQMEATYQEQCKQLAEDWQRLEKHQAESLASLRTKEAELDKRRQLLQCERDEEMAAICVEHKALIGVRGSILKENKSFLEFLTNKLQHVLSNNNTETLKEEFKSLLVLAAEKYCEGLQTSLCWSDVSLSTSPMYFSSPSPDSNGWINLSSAHALLKDGIVKDIISHHKATLAGLESELRAKAMSVSEREKRVNEIDRELNAVPCCSTPLHDSNFDKTKQSLSLRTSEELNHILQKKQNLSLDLTVTGDTHTTSPETCDTYHTASPSPPIMSDSGVGLGLEETNLPQQRWIDDSDDASSTDESYRKSLKQGQNMARYKPRMLFPKINSSDKNLGPAETVKALKQLMQKITRQRLQIMHSLESDIDTVETNKQIAVLQEMKKEYILLEKQIRYDCGKENIHNQEESDDLSTSADDTNSDSNCDSVKLYGSKHLETLSRSSNDLSLQNLQNHRVQSPLSPILNFSSSSQQIDRLQAYNYALARSMPSLNPSTGWDNNSDASLDVRVPTYVLRGAGSATHYAYEVRLRVGGEYWAILRRYSRFRELHLNMKYKYGAKVAALHFPPRRLFSRQAEWLARERRPQLEAYLKSLLAVCGEIPGTPLYFAKDNLTKLALHELSPFFRRGVFETGKHGTS